MAITSVISYPTRGSKLLVNGESVVNVQSISGVGGGTAGTIETTSFSSQAREYITGYSDEGTVTVSGIAAPQSDSSIVLEDLKRSGATASWEVVFGHDRGDDGLATGEGHVIATEAFSTIAATQGVTNSYTINLDKSADNVAGVSVGDFVKIGTASAYHRVIGRGRKSNGDATIDVQSATTLTTSSAGTIDIVRPAVRYTWSGQVSSYAKNLDADSVVNYSLTIQVTGEVIETIGTPDLS